MKNMHVGIAAGITKAASKQTYYTIRFLADHDRVADAYRAYAYFRWVDDVLDGAANSRGERSDFIQRQKSLLVRCHRNESIRDANTQEQMLVELVEGDSEKDSGLQSYVRNMMEVMSFDAERRGREISQNELTDYTRWLATAVTEAVHHCIGHGCSSPRDASRYLAVSGAHIAHMLRDTFDDIQAGYYNIPQEILSANRIRVQDVESDAYRAWVRSRVQLARWYFRFGKKYFCEIGNLRCRLAGFAYIARFEWLLDTFEEEGYCLRPKYDERRSLGTALRMSLDTLTAMLHLRGAGTIPKAVSIRTRSAR